MFFDIRDYILIEKNVIPLDLCDAVIQEYKHSEDWVNTTIARGSDRDYRKCDTINTSNPNIINKNPEVRNRLDQELFKCAGTAIAKYREKFGETNIEGDSGYSLLRYQEGEFYKQHTDSFLTQPRIVSCSFALNDGYEGGEWGFFNRELVITVPKGAAVMFPSNFMYPHEIMPVTRGVRYSIITWFI